MALSNFILMKEFWFDAFSVKTRPATKLRNKKTLKTAGRGISQQNNYLKIHLYKTTKTNFFCKKMSENKFLLQLFFNFFQTNR